MKVREREWRAWDVPGIWKLCDYNIPLPAASPSKRIAFTYIPSRYPAFVFMQDAAMLLWVSAFLIY
jgi:hypothetical protein